jgi:hypothetical protein
LAFLLVAFSVIDIECDPTIPASIGLIVGPGGTGKTVLVRTITDWMDAMGKPNKLRRAAPTATAASKILGCTIHKLHSLRVKIKDNADAEDTLPIVRPEINVSDATRDEWRDVQLLLIDEVPMLGHSSARPCKKPSPPQKELKTAGRSGTSTSSI